MILYFAYGSNLDIEQMAHRCPGAVPVEFAEVPGRLAFVGYSAYRHGSVATILPVDDDTQTVKGLLWEVSEQDLVRLDGYESGYLRVEDESGDDTVVWYLHTSEDERHAPSESYFALLLSAYEELGWDTVPLKKARVAFKKYGPGCLDRVFVYGTLMRGESNHHVIADCECESKTTYVSGFRMVSCGGFPGAVPGAASIVGEVYQVGQATLEMLDHLEGVPTLYKRAKTTTDDGRFVWIYLLNDSVKRPVIASGSWRKYRKVKNELE